MDSCTNRTTFRVGSVSFLNAKPLIYGLEKQPDVSLLMEVPSRLLGGLKENLYDIALLPVIDFHRLHNLCMVPSGGIGSDGPTLTVRVFSRVPVGEIASLACDSDSHTSVALARIILQESYGIRPRFTELADREHADAYLLIGDKVIQEETRTFAHDLDLGGAWKELTGLPFVFAIWMARRGNNLGEMPRRLQNARLQGVAHIDEIVKNHAAKHGWPADVARKYLTKHLTFEIGPAQIQAMKLFGELAGKLKLIDGPVRELEFYP